jgi:hypothetical protein
MNSIVIVSESWRRTLGRGMLIQRASRSAKTAIRASILVFKQ